MQIWKTFATKSIIQFHPKFMLCFSSSQHLHLPIDYNSLYVNFHLLNSFNPISSITPVHSLAHLFPIFLLYALSRRGKTFLSQNISDQNVTAIITLTVAAKPLQGGETAYSTFKILFPSCESYSSNIPTKRQLARQMEMLPWSLERNQCCICTTSWIPSSERFKISSEIVGRVEEISYCYLATLKKSYPVMEGRSHQTLFMYVCVKNCPFYGPFQILWHTMNMQLKALQKDSDANATPSRFQLQFYFR